MRKEREIKHRGVKADNIRDFKVLADGTLLESAALILKDHSASKVKSMLKHRQFAINGTPTMQFDQAVHEGDVLSVNFSQSFAMFKHPRIRLVYEDEHVLVVDKGYGILSMATEREKEGTVYSVLREYVKTNNPAAHIYILHRLDRNTSGVMVLAKTPEAKDVMQHNWNNMVIARKYVAVVEGEVEKDEDVVRSYLAETSQYEVYSTQDSQKGQLAITRYKTVRRRGGYSMLELELDTGRKNQIRVHMHDIGHPISGDRKYGAGPSPIHRVALHAHTLKFVHPITRKLMSFESPVPASFMSLV